MDKKETAVLVIAILQIIFSAEAISAFNPLTNAVNLVSILSLILSIVILVFAIGLLQGRKSATMGFIYSAYAIIALVVIRTGYYLVTNYSAATQQGLAFKFIIALLFPLVVSVVYYCIAIKVLRNK